MLSFTPVEPPSTAPGHPLPKQVKPYGPAEAEGKGGYYLRSMFGAQPAVLRKGDILATGETVRDEPRDARDGKNIFVNLDGAWELVPARLFLGFSTIGPPPPIAPEWLALAAAERLGGQLLIEFP